MLRRMKRVFVRLVLASLLTSPTFLSVAVAAPSRWLTRPWQAEDGLPDISIAGLAQTSDGYIWVATVAGLVSFNGQDFALVPQANLVGAPARPVRAMIRDQRDGLWLGMERGPLLCLRLGGLENMTVKAGLPAQRVLMMAEDGEGAMFLVYPDHQLFRVADGVAERIAGGAHRRPQGADVSRSDASAASTILDTVSP